MIEECLSDYIIPFALFVGENFSPMQDNIASPVNDYQDEIKLHQINWPLHSTDLNSIEHVLDLLWRLARNQQPESN